MSLLGAFIVPHPPLIIPAVGRGEEQKIQSTIDAYEKVGRETAELAPDTIVVISPHSVMYADYIHISPGNSARGDFGRFRAKDVVIGKKYDTDFVESLCETANRAGIPAGTLGEKDKSIDHGVLVPLYFVEKYYKSYELVRISISGLPALEHYRFGQCIANTAEALGRNIVVIASGDLSHKLKEDGPYGFAAEGPEFDSQITEAMAAGDFMRFLNFDEEFTEAAAECGLRSFIEMAGALDGKAVEPSFLSYEGTFGVGYAICGYKISGPDGNRHFGDRLEKMQLLRVAAIKNEEDEYVRLARQSLECFVKTGEHLKQPGGLSDELTSRRAGTFVSLKKDGKLRGCIGTVSPAQACVADEIINNAVSSGTQDPRFDAVTIDELDSLVYSVDVLSEPHPAAATEDLDVKRYGVIVTRGARRGLLLPNLEGVDTPEQQVAIALEKAGISAHEKYSIERFEVVRHK